jgi:hypothetical protein
MKQWINDDGEYNRNNDSARSSGVSRPEILATFEDLGLPPADVRAALLRQPGVVLLGNEALVEFVASYDRDKDHHIWVLAGGEIVMLALPHGVTTELIKVELFKTHRRFKLNHKKLGKISHYQFFIAACGAIRVHLKGSMECIVMGLPSEISIAALEALKRQLNMDNLNIDYYSSSGNLKILKTTDELRQFVALVP